MAISGSNHPPYRAPCFGTALCGNSPRYQNAKATEKNLAVWLYNGMVPNWDECAGQTANIPPYERPNPTYIDQATDDCGGGGTTYTQPNGRWLGICSEDDTYAPCTSGASPAPGTANEIFDLTNTPPDSWYQPQMLTGTTILNGGANYQVGDLLDLNGGMVSSYIIPPSGIPSLTAYVAVSAVDESGTITALTIPCSGSYLTIPSSPNSVTGGHGTGASIALTFSNQTESLAQCRKIGFKNVQAMRQCHGQPGYYFNAPSAAYFCPDDQAYDDGDLCVAVPYQAYSTSASQTKYLTAEVTISLTAYNYDNINEDKTFCFSDEYAFSVSVNANSGVFTVNSASYGCGAAATYASFATQGVDAWMGTFMNWQTNGYGPQTSAPTSFSCDESGFSWDYEVGTVTQSGGGFWSVSSDSFSATNTFAQSDTSETESEGNWTNTQSVSVSDDGVGYSFSGLGLGDFPEECGTDTYIDLIITVAYSDANAASGVMSDINTLLDEWDMTDDALYPWRADANTSMAPLVSRNEVPGNITPLIYPFAEAATETTDCLGFNPGDPFYTSTYEYTALVDPNSYLFDGSILGAPTPPGYQGFFDFRWEDWQNAGDIGGLPDYEIYGWGAKNTGQYGIPLNATQWTNVQQGIQFPGGAWIFYNCNPSVAGNGDCFNPGAGCPQPGAVLMAQKWAETKVPLPSQNFFRPAGNDRFVHDEENVYAILSTSDGPGSGTQINLGNTANCDATTSVVASGLWGPYQNTDGNWYFWSVTGGGASVTLNQPVYLLPDNWQSASGDGEASDPSMIACFGKLRWATGIPATDPFPILGRAGVSAVAEYESNPDVTELTTDSLPTLGMIQADFGYDEIDIYDKTMTLITGDLEVTRIDDSHFTVPVAPSTLANAVWIQSHGTPAYHWDDQYPKGDYVYTDWTYWPRQSYEPTRINSIFDTCNAAACGDTNTSGCDCSAITCETPAANVFSAFTQEAGCVPLNPCNPAVLCISPNDESFPNGVTFAFPSINLDEEYGSGWQAEIQQSMVDLLWQPPHVPATYPCVSETRAWTEDDGTCESNSETQTFYAHRPLVEARLTTPAGAPALPAGITIGWVSPVTDPDSPDALYPAPSNGPGLGGNVPWAILDNECSCIQGGGSFADIYEDQVVTCD